MKKRCTPQLVKKTWRRARSWRKAAQELNEIYGVKLYYFRWRDYAMGHRDIVDPTIRAALLLGPQQIIKAHFLHLLMRMKPKDLNYWHELRKQGKFPVANNLLDEVYIRPITKKLGDE